MIYLLIYPFAVVLSLTATLLAVALSPVIALFADSSGNLPRALSYFQTFDATLDELGTGYWKRVLWLWRNPGYGFDFYLFGLKWDKSEWTIRHYVNDTTRTEFVAVGRGFNVYYCGPIGTLKIGWKAWNHYSSFNSCWYEDAWYPDKSWATRNPICFSYNPFIRK